MKILYSRAKSNSAILSRGISLFSKNKGQDLDHVPSHMSLLFFNRLILEARGGGVILNYLETFKKKNEILAAFEYRGEAKEATKLYNALDTYHGMKYDFISIFWYTVFLLRKFIFGISLPNMGKWQKTHRSYCSELIKVLEVDDYVYLTPNDQMLALMKDDRFKRLL